MGGVAPIWVSHIAVSDATVELGEDLVAGRELPPWSTARSIMFPHAFCDGFPNAKPERAHLKADSINKNHLTAKMLDV